MAILVTGGAGYIGSVVVDDLIDSGVEVSVLDNLSRGHRSSVSDQAKFYEGDIGNKDIVRRICEESEITAVMHFSAFAYVGESVERPDVYYHNNVVQTLILLDALIESGVKQFVFSSSCATYGEPEYVPLDEKHPQRPTSPYGCTKLFVEQILSDYHESFDLKFVALRYFNACGATDKRGEQHDPETHLIPLILEAAAGKRPHISVFGDDYPTPDGTAIRDYIHVSDISQAHLLALRHLHLGGDSEFINLGNGLGYSVMNVIESARRVTGQAIEARVEARRPGDPSRLVANASKAHTVLGWHPRITDLDSIIASAWNRGR